ncbi:MAG: imidazole glycerol phosphate synthase subunit HisH [Actinomycetota bacterium]
MSGVAKIAVLDYGFGNIRSVERALQRSGSDVAITSDFESAINADGLVVPGVGAFGQCMSGLRSIRGDEVIRERLRKNRPTLGLCVGLQILFESSAESEGIDGVAIFNERIERIAAPILPHMGWNLVNTPASSILFDGIERERFYFVHSYGRLQGDASERAEYLPSWSEHGSRFLAALEFGSLSATQFHPEKSGEAGLHLLENWVRSFQ